VSVTEVKEAIEKLSDAEQLELTQYLQAKRLHNAEWLREMSRRLDEMDAGKKFGSAEVEAFVGNLDAEGR